MGENLTLKMPKVIEDKPKVESIMSKPMDEDETVYGVFANSEPVMKAVDGIKYDFNEGLRVKFPKEGGPWRVIFKDLDTDTVLFNNDITSDMQLQSIKKYFVRFQFQIFKKEHLDTLTLAIKKNPSLAHNKDYEPKPIFEHTYNATGKDVMIQLPVPTVGDTLGWFPYVEKFRVKHKCHVIAVMKPQFIELFKNQYPEITFITKEEVNNYKPYACYYLGLFFKGDTNFQPCDFRMVGNHRTAGYILGVDPTEEKPRFDLSEPRKIKEPYVCIATQSSTQAKYWNNPNGWYEVIKFLKNNGYRVLCIDQKPVHGTGLVWDHIPNGCEDFTGDIPLQERINLIKDAEFFIGLSSGLSWVAWGCNVPVVMISGFSHPNNEFYTPYRIINYHACNSCWNDLKVDFDHYDFLWCPRHKNDDQQFECTRMISSTQVINAIKTIPSFKNYNI